MKLVFMGSPDFAVPCLDAVVAAGHEVALVVTQPDKPAGRGGAMTAPAVKLAAERLGLPVLQPTKLRPPEVAAGFAATGAELAVVVAYGRILPASVLTAFSSSRAARRFPRSRPSRQTASCAPAISGSWMKRVTPKLWTARRT